MHSKVSLEKKTNVGDDGRKKGENASDNKECEEEEGGDDDDEEEEEGEISSRSGASTPDINHLIEETKPCMRIIVESSENSQQPKGTLFIVPFTGGSVGREGDHHQVLLTDVGCSKFHAKIRCDEDDRFTLTDLGSRNGTFINGKRISVAKRESDAVPVGHGTKLQIGTTKMLCHVHPGKETCFECEPGLLREAEKVVYPAVIDRKAEMRVMKKKYGLRGEDERISTNEDIEKKYGDRAKKRRKEFGSDNPYEKTETASLDKAIEKSNKGFKMLSKMGWKEGDGLGSTVEGRKEPVKVEMRNERAGLGSDQGPKIDLKMKKKSEVWKKAQERFESTKLVEDVLEDNSDNNVN